MRCLSIRTSAVRAVAVVLALVVLGSEGPVSAQPVPPSRAAILDLDVTAPTDGVVLAATSPITVTWTSDRLGPISVNIVTGNNVQTLNIAPSVPHTGQYTFTLPDAFICDPQASYRLLLWQTVSGAGVYGSYSGTFKLTCPITVTKQVVNTTGRRVPGAFRMRVQCEPGSQTFADITAPGPGSYSRKVRVPSNSTVCTVQEIGMPLPPIGCTWLTTYPGGQQRPPGGSVTVVNTLQCEPVSPPTGR